MFRQHGSEAKRDKYSSLEYEVDICPSMQVGGRDHNISGKLSISGSLLTSLALASFPGMMKRHLRKIFLFVEQTIPLNPFKCGEFSSIHLFKWCCSNVFVQITCSPQNTPTPQHVAKMDCRVHEIEGIGLDFGVPIAKDKDLFPQLSSLSSAPPLLASRLQFHFTGTRGIL